MPSSQSSTARAYRHSVLLMAFVLTVIMFAIHAGCTRSQEEPKAPSAKPQIPRNEAITIATEQARQLGYDPNKMSVECEEGANGFVIVFLPPADQLGGDLTVEVDASTGRVTGILRGQ